MRAGRKFKAAAPKGKILEKTGGPSLSCSSVQLLVTVNRYTFHCCISDCAVNLSIPTDLHTFPYYEFEDVSPQSMAAAADGSTIVTVQGRLKEHSTF